MKQDDMEWQANRSLFFFSREFGTLKRRGRRLSHSRRILMQISGMQVWLLLIVFFGLAFSEVPGLAQRAKMWEVKTPIVTYWAGPAMTDAAAQQLADGGWNLVWCKESELDVAGRHHLRAQLTDPLLKPASLDDPVRRAALDALIERVKKNPALYCYFITDEPSASSFADLGRLVAHLKQHDPAHMAYINLFPTYASSEQLGTEGDTVTAYNEYLQKFIDIVKPYLISYDHYQFAAKSDMPDYFLNLALVRRAAMDANLPFLNIVQACTWTPSMREPDEAEMRYLVNTTLAYGAQGISYYVYSHPGHTPGIATLDGKPTRVYEWLSKLNREFAAVASQVHSLHSIGVYHTGMMPPGAVPLPDNSPFTIDPPIPSMEFIPSERVKGVLLGCFGKSGDLSQVTHVFVVNLDYMLDASLTICGPGALEEFDSTTQKWASCHDKRVTLNLPPGGGKLIRVRR
jgi:hypothetical protein